MIVRTITNGIFLRNRVTTLSIHLYFVRRDFRPSLNCMIIMISPDGQYITEFCCHVQMTFTQCEVDCRQLDIINIKLKISYVNVLLWKLWLIWKMIINTIETGEIRRRTVRESLDLYHLNRKGLSSVVLSAKQITFIECRYTLHVSSDWDQTNWLF